MKKSIVIFLIFSILLSMGLLTPAYAAGESQIQSGYYSIDRASGLIGQITPGTPSDTLLSRLLPGGDFKLSAGVATGSVLSLSRSGSQTDKLSLVVLSDCSGDGIFSVSDMLMVKSLLLNQKKFSNAQRLAADVSGDNAVTITDFLQMKSKILGLGDFTPRAIPNGEAKEAVILTVGQTYDFGPADGVLAGAARRARSGAWSPIAEPAESTAVPTAAEPTESSADPAEIPTEPTQPSTEPTEPPTEPTEPPTSPTELPTTPTEPPTAPTEPPTVPTEPPTVPTEPPKILTVEGDAISWSSGKITALKVGTARITYEGQSLIITVCKEGLKVSLPTAPLYVLPGATAQLQPVLNHPVHSGFTYSSANTGIAKVNAQGVVTGVATGNTKVTVTLPNGTSATQEIRVIRLVSSLSLNQSSIKLKAGTTKKLTASVTPADSPEKLIWTSSDSSIATVDSSGLVTGRKNGTVTVTCTTEYGKVAASCKVKVCNLIQVALTFDDGPSSSYTGKLLDTLKQYNIPATFFMVGSRISTSPSSVKRMASEGHELGYHTWGHTYFSSMTATAIKSDLAKFQQTLKDTCGKTATVYRAPGGTITSTALSTISMPHIMWSVDTRDWEHRDSTRVKNAIINGLKDGAIILLHDIHGPTYTGTKAALEYIFAKDMDVEFLTITELLSRKGSAPQNGTTYYKG